MVVRSLCLPIFVWLYQVPMAVRTIALRMMPRQALVPIMVAQENIVIDGRVVEQIISNMLCVILLEVSYDSNSRSYTF